MNNMQVMLHMINELKSLLPLELLIEKLTSGPRRILDRPNPVIDKGQVANLTLFDPTRKWHYDKSSNLSKSENSPFFGQEVTGKVVAVFNNGQFIEN